MLKNGRRAPYEEIKQNPPENDGNHPHSHSENDRKALSAADTLTEVGMKTITVRDRKYAIDESCLHDLKQEFAYDICYGAVEDMDFQTWLDRHATEEVLAKYGAKEIS